MSEGVRAGRVIKAVTGGQVVKAPLAEAHARAAELRAQVAAQQAAWAQEEARARAELAALKDEARARGWAEGYAEGREAGLAEITATLVAARQEADAILCGARASALVLARHMAAKIVGRAIALDEGVLADIAAEALSEARARSGRVVLRVHPDALAAFERQRSRLQARLGAGVALAFVEDATVDPGGCIVESTSVRVDARLSVQLDALERALQEARRDD